MLYLVHRFVVGDRNINPDTCNIWKKRNERPNVGGVVETVVRLEIR